MSVTFFLHVQVLDMGGPPPYSCYHW